MEPDFYYNSVHDIPYQKLYNDNYRGLIFDIDNTLTAFDQALPPEKTTALIKRLKSMGFGIFLLTNNTGKRMKGFNEHLNLPGRAWALKPLTGGIKKAMKIMGTTKANTVIIGDQLLADVWAGKNARITTILVKPITERDFAVVQVKRHIERALLKRYFEGLKKKGEGDSNGRQ